ncbi:MAG: hypothetical protein QOE54_6057 [Streptosporangiaceae bacterium]|jgi:nitroreductase|nr:hypothetical protein [Streptosporangiaceae bacterium]
MSDLTVDEVLTTTRSVRLRLDLTRPVPLELVKECLRIALQAPSGSNTQGWRWIVVTDPDLRAAVGEVYRRACERYLKSEKAVGKLFADDVARSEIQQRVHRSTVHLAERMGQVPVQVIGCLELPSPELPAGNQAGLWGSLLPAAWSYMLAARARGLGTAWTTLHLMYEEEVARLLGLPGNVRQGVLIPTAYYTGTDFKPAPRQALEEVLHLNGW